MDTPYALSLVQIYDQLNMIVEMELEKASPEQDIDVLIDKILTSNPVRNFFNRNPADRNLWLNVTQFIKFKQISYYPQDFLNQLLLLSVRLQSSIDLHDNIFGLDDIIDLFSSLGHRRWSKYDELDSAAQEILSQLEHLFQWMQVIESKLTNVNLYGDYEGVRNRELRLLIDNQIKLCLTVLSASKAEQLNISRLSAVSYEPEGSQKAIDGLLELALGAEVNFFLETESFAVISDFSYNRKYQVLVNMKGIHGFFSLITGGTTRGGFDNILPSASNDELCAYVHRYLQMRLESFFYTSMLKSLIAVVLDIHKQGFTLKAMKILLELDNPKYKLDELKLGQNNLDVLTKIRSFYQNYSTIRQSFEFFDREKYFIRHTDSLCLWLNQIRRHYLCLLAHIQFGDIRKPLADYSEEQFMSLQSLKDYADPGIEYPENYVLTDPRSINCIDLCYVVAKNAVFKAIQLNLISFMEGISGIRFLMASLTNEEGLSPLAYAASIGNLAIIKLILECYLDQTNLEPIAMALCYAVQSRQVKCQDYLMTKDISLDARVNYQGKYVALGILLNIAGHINELCEAGRNQEIREYCSRFKINLKEIIEVSTRKRPLISAVMAGQSSTVRMLIDEFECSVRVRYQRKNLLELANQLPASSEKDELIMYLEGKFALMAPQLCPNRLFSVNRILNQSLIQSINACLQLITGKHLEYPHSNFLITADQAKLSPDEFACALSFIDCMNANELLGHLFFSIQRQADGNVLITYPDASYQTEGNIDLVVLFFQKVYELFDDWKQDNEKSQWMTRLVDSEMGDRYCKFLRQLKSIVFKDFTIQLRLNKTFVDKKIKIDLFKPDFDMIRDLVFNQTQNDLEATNPLKLG